MGAVARRAQPGADHDRPLIFGKIINDDTTRPPAIMHADTIIVPGKGKIAETGTHNELVEHKGLYYAMWRQQIGERRSPVAAQDDNNPEDEEPEEV